MINLVKYFGVVQVNAVGVIPIKEVFQNVIEMVKVLG
jgi:hypothetical protein